MNYIVNQDEIIQILKSNKNKFKLIIKFKEPVIISNCYDTAIDLINDFLKKVLVNWFIWVWYYNIELPKKTKNVEIILYKKSKEELNLIYF